MYTFFIKDLASVNWFEHPAKQSHPKLLLLIKRDRASFVMKEGCPCCPTFLILTLMSVRAWNDLFYNESKHNLYVFYTHLKAIMQTHETETVLGRLFI